MPQSCRLVLLTGVSGTGKTTAGEMLAKELGWEFHDGDSYHSAGNVEKMRSGSPLTDTDRGPWLVSIHVAMAECLRNGRGAVFACSALREAYRRVLLDGLDDVGVVFLHGNFDAILGRMNTRRDHYMKPGMLRSQFDTLEAPEDALAIDVASAPGEIVRQIREHFEI